MRVVRHTEDGGPEVLRVTQVPEPEVDPSGVLIRITAAGLNRADALQRMGRYPVPPHASDILGMEVSGVVERLGDEVPDDAGLSVGDRVVALVDSGAYADAVVAPWPQVLPLPEGVDPVAAAGLPEVVATVFSNVFMAAAAREGETLLVHGGAGGIGTCAIQMARVLGMKVIATAGSDEKVDLIERLGATGINYRTEDFGARVAELTDGEGVNVILDVVGAKYLDANIDALAVNGRMVIIGLLGGAKGEIALNKLMDKRIAVIGTKLRPRPLEEKATIMRGVREVVWPHVASGAITAVVDRTFPLEQVREAHEYFDSGTHTGKVLLTM